MSSNLSLLPYKYNVTYNSSALTIPAFPGAYIYNAGIDTSPTALPVPIYCSEPAITTYFMFDRDYMLLVLPGFKVEIYADVSFGTFKYSVDNTAGTDLKFFANKTGSYTMSSYKLFYSFPMVGTQELTMNMSYSSAVSSGNAEISIIPLTYDNTSYTLYSYKTTGTSTFQYTGPTDVPAFVLVVGGGGAGGRGGNTTGDNERQGGGGGGAGGVMVGTMTFIKNTTYNCIVGNGGQSSNANGGVSTITNTSNNESVNANGGGGGGAPPSIRAGSGGSSGGNCSASGYGPTNYLISRTAGTNTITGGSFDDLGNGGGHAYGVVNPFLGGGGGGGARGGGGPAGGKDDQTGGTGGAGYNWPLNNTNYAGGGGAGSGAAFGNPANSQSIGGSGGGGKGGLTKYNSNFTLSHTAPENGTNGLGGGGGGGGTHSTAFGIGGSGIIIIALRTADIYKLSK